MNGVLAKLTHFFEKLPGIGPRQARRFVFSLLRKDQPFLNELAKTIISLKKEVADCQECGKFFENHGMKKLCSICSSTVRDKNSLLIVERDIDLENIEKAGFYNGFYFILGGLLPAVGAEIPEEVKMKTLFEKVKKEASSKNLGEVILGLNATLEGDNTSRYIEKILEPINKVYPIKISRLGRGLSTGTELEYSDKETIENAFKNRK